MIKYNSQSYTPLWSRTLFQLWSNQTTKYLSLQGDQSLRSGDFRKNSWQSENDRQSREEGEMKWSLPSSRGLDAANTKNDPLSEFGKIAFATIYCFRYASVTCDPVHLPRHRSDTEWVQASHFVNRYGVETNPPLPPLPLCCFQLL